MQKQNFTVSFVHIYQYTVYSHSGCAAHQYIRYRELTCFRKITQGATERTPLQSLSHGVSVIQTSAAHGAISRLFLQSRHALRHTGPDHPFLLLQLSCKHSNTHISYIYHTHSHGQQARAVCFTHTSYFSSHNILKHKNQKDPGMSIRNESKVNMH